MIFNEVKDFCDFVDNYEGELRILFNKAYDNNQLVAQCTYHRNK